MTDRSTHTQATFFATPADFRAWLIDQHSTAQELWVGFYKKETGIPSITWPEAVDEALCFGWIDGIRKRIDDSSYAIRFTPRKTRSIWSAVNIKRALELKELGRMYPAGITAFERRSEQKSGVYAYEQRTAELDAASQEQFRANPEAWAYFQAQAPGYRRTAVWWVISAKKPETRQKRLATLIEYSARHQPIPQLNRSNNAQ